MDVELEPVGDHEFILRRVLMSDYKASLPIPIQRSAFRPNDKDVTGISVYRVRFVIAYTDALFAVKPEKRGLYYVARLSVAKLKELALTVVPDPDPDDIPGHCIIPELSSPIYNANKANHDRLARIQFELAALASQNIVHQATSCQ